MRGYLIELIKFCGEKKISCHLNYEQNGENSFEIKNKTIFINVNNNTDKEKLKNFCDNIMEELKNRFN